MQDFEQEALALGIPVKTRHNEVAPAQHEMAPVFEKASKAVDHNVLLMELMRQVAIKHGLSCLLHEKPFRGLNGSGKHCNWSLSTDSGFNLLDPSETPENKVHFLVLLIAVIKAVNKHAALLRASVAYAGNDQRLGGHEAPPPIISIYLGKELEAVLDRIENAGKHAKKTSKSFFDLDVVGVPELTKDNTDRNRTSPFAFTGNKFEFRAVGSSANPAFPITVLNTIVAESLNEIMDEIDLLLTGKAHGSQEELLEAILPVLRKTIIESKKVCFEGDNYSKEWHEEAMRRGLPILQKAVHAFHALKSDTTITAFKGVLTEGELRSRYDVAHETYAHTIQIEAGLMLDIFRTQVLPVALEHQKLAAESLLAYVSVVGKGSGESQQEKQLKEINGAIELSLKRAHSLEDSLQKAGEILDLQTRSLFFCEDVLAAGEMLRASVDGLETVINDSLWPLPKYRELLFMV